MPLHRVVFYLEAENTQEAMTMAQQMARFAREENHKLKNTTASTCEVSAITPQDPETGKWRY
jgi:hypothetical protein